MNDIVIIALNFFVLVIVIKLIHSGNKNIEIFTKFIEKNSKYTCELIENIIKLEEKNNKLEKKLKEYENKNKVDK